MSFCIRWRRRDVALPPRDQMDVDVRDFLSRSFSHIRANIEARDTRIGAQNFEPALDKQMVNRFTLLCRAIKIIDDMPRRNNEAM